LDIKGPLYLHDHITVGNGWSKDGLEWWEVQMYSIIIRQPHNYSLYHAVINWSSKNYSPSHDNTSLLQSAAFTCIIAQMLLDCAPKNVGINTSLF